MIAAIAEVFEFRPDWHRQDRAVRLVRQYDLKLTSVLESHPDLHDCLGRCCHCGIRFLTYRCNRGRRDLRCPFGCRQHHRRQQANARSRKHYRTPEGKQRKEEHNFRRSPIDQQDASSGDGPPSGSPPDSPSESPPDSPSESPSNQPSKSHDNYSSGSHDNQPVQDNQPINQWRESATHQGGSLTATWTLEQEGVTLTNETLERSPVLSYLCLVVRLIEQRSIGPEELRNTLGESLRQRSLGARARREYVLAYLNEHPPPEYLRPAPHEPIGRTNQS